jgi:hypothetical protein
VEKSLDCCVVVEDILCKFETFPKKYFKSIIIICKVDIVPCPLLFCDGNVVVILGFIFNIERSKKRLFNTFLDPILIFDLCYVLGLFSLIKDCIIFHFQVLILCEEARMK